MNLEREFLKYAKLNAIHEEEGLVRDPEPYYTLQIAIPESLLAQAAALSEKHTISIFDVYEYMIRYSDLNLIPIELEGDENIVANFALIDEADLQRRLS